MKITRRQLERIIRESLQLEMFDTGSAGNEVGGTSLAQKKEQCELAGGKWISDDPSGKYGHCSQPIKENKPRRGSVELTERPEASAVNDAWPDSVFHNGKKVMETFYGGSRKDDQAYQQLESEGYDGQEVYLGYDPQSDNFVMGFDAFYYGVDEYGDSDPGNEMEGVMILLDPRGRVLETIDYIPGGVYPAGINAIEKTMPEIIHVRLD
jgi:hypothetical protein